jgi:hypothetical protein
MAAIVAKRPESLADDRDGTEVALTPTERIDAAAPPDDQAALDTARQLAVQSDTTIISDDQLAKLMVRTKVNGVEQLVPLDQVRAGFQKTESADKYLAEAKQLLNEVKAVGRQQPAATPAAEEGTTAAPDTTSQEADPIDEFTDALFQGDEKRAKDLLRKAVGGTATVKAQDIARQVEQQIVIRSALRQFAQDHREITSDPTLSRKADEFLFQVTGGRQLDELAPEQVPVALQAAGKATKEWLRSVSGLGPSANAGPATTRSERLSRKETIDELPSASVRSSSTEPQPKTAVDVIAAMKRARGQV